MNSAKNREIQDERMRSYFIEATKNLLRGEGIKSISVRHVADRAGYSYATMYHYFRDINELLFLCVSDFQAEAEQYIADQKISAANPRAAIRETAVAYARYFVDYPGVWELFFLEKMGTTSNKGEIALLITGFLNRLTQGYWDAGIKQGTFTKDITNEKRELLGLMVAGALLYYENRNTPESRELFMELLNSQIEIILR